MTTLLRMLVVFFLVAVTAVTALAQPAQTIQLPTFGFTTVSTTVVVPDQGSTLLGSVNRSSSGTNSLGTPLVGKVPMFGRPFGNRAIGRSQSGGTLSVHATIHDFEAMDQALLAQAAANRARRGLAAPGADRQLVGQDPATASVASIQRQRAADAQQVGDEIQDLFRRAEAAQAKGKPHVAKIFYRMIAREATGPARQLAEARLAGLNDNRADRFAAGAPR